MATMPPKLHRHCRKSNSSPPAILPNELITDILSRLRVKYVMQMKCVSKSWNTLISDPIFIKMHLNRSSLTPQFALKNDHTFVPFPVSLLWENRNINLTLDPYYRLSGNNFCQIVGSCNGLICLVGYFLNKITMFEKIWFRFWNPATRTISDKLEFLFYYNEYEYEPCKFAFGYDNSTEGYKVVKLRLVTDCNVLETNVEVFSLRDNVWGTTQRIQASPLQLFDELDGHDEYDGVQLSCTINWMSVQSVYRGGDIDEQFVIVSLDLSTEKFTQLMPPENFVIGGEILPNICVLMDSLCFSYIKESELFIWQMTKFGDEKSWSQFLKFNYHNFAIDYEVIQQHIKLTPLHLSKDGDTLVLANYQQSSAILYNRRNNTATKTTINHKICRFFIRDYTESLVSTC